MRAAAVGWGEKQTVRSGKKSTSTEGIEAAPVVVEADINPESRRNVGEDDAEANLLPIYLSLFVKTQHGHY